MNELDILLEPADQVFLYLLGLTGELRNHEQIKKVFNLRRQELLAELKCYMIKTDGGRYWTLYGSKPYIIMVAAEIPYSVGQRSVVTLEEL
jgi:hypothetical protein